MRISTRGEYGTRAMLEIALHYKQGPITLKDIAAKQAISEPYLEQLAASLRKAGLISSTRGAQGGYELVRAPAEITISDIIKALEGPITPVGCVNEDITETGCQNPDKCATRLLWTKLRDCIVSFLETTTLADLVETTLELNKDSVMYYI